MVKTKSKKSVVALVVMALLLVASIVMGITGAWFTDRIEKTHDTQIAFGKIDLEMGTTFSVSSEHTPAMPGCKLSVAGTIENNGEAAYYAYKIALLFDKDLAIGDTEDLNGWAYASNTLSYTSAVAEFAKGATAVDLSTLEVTLPTSLGNTVQEATTTKITLTVVAIQKDHNTMPESYAALEAVAQARGV